MDPLLRLYFIKRVFLFLDEWAFYLLTFYAAALSLRVPDLRIRRFMAAAVLVMTTLGFLFLTTSYQNIDIIERALVERLGVQEAFYFVYPFR